MHGGVAVADLGTENLKALELGFSNLKRHVENMRKYGFQLSLRLMSSHKTPKRSEH